MHSRQCAEFCAVTHQIGAAVKSTTIYFLIAAAAVIGSVAIIITKQIPQEELSLLVTKGVIPETLIRGKSVRGRIPANGLTLGSSGEEVAPPLERTDEELKQVLTMLPVLKEIPWENHQIAQMYSNNTARSCLLLPPATPVEMLPGAQAEENFGLGKLVGQRVTAFQIGLMMDRRAQAALPRISKATIENVLDQHLLAIQPEIFKSRDGEFLLTGDIHAAYFAKNRPSITGDPDPMIRDAVRSFRVLGVLPPATTEGSTEGALPRTLVMAFAYKRDKDLSTTMSLGPQDEFELLFLHLLPQSQVGGGANLAVFATSEGRTVFQELETTSGVGLRSEPSVMAAIRFEKFVMNALPQDPVVTAISNRVRNSISVEELRNRVASKGNTASSLEAILDEIHHGSSVGVSPAQASFSP